jgi:hypothetical protein
MADYDITVTVPNQGPKGETGDTGPANTLAVGTVTTLAAGAAATATITGAAPNQTLALGIPQGPIGQPGSNALTGFDSTPLKALLWTNPDTDVVRERINNDNSKTFANFGALPSSFYSTAADLEFYRDFAGRKTLDHGAGPSITFTRNSNATFFDADGVLQTATTNAPRFDHDPASSNVSRGLLIEEARTNLLLHSADLSNAAWTKTDITAAKDQTGINGAANSASSITATSANGTCLQAITSASAARATSAYVKRITGTGVIEMTQNGGTTWTAVTVTSDWTRVTIPSATVTNPSVGFRIVTSGDAIAVDAVQCENGAFSTSAILTTTTTATRAADSAVVTPISSFYNQAEGTLFAEGSATNSGAQSGAVLSIDDTTANNRIQMRRFATFSSVNTLVSNSSPSLADAGTNSWPLGSTVKIALAVKAADLARSINGGAITSAATTVALPSGLSRMEIGNGINSAYANGHIRKIAYWPRRLSNTLLQQLTT